MSSLRILSLGGGSLCRSCGAPIVWTITEASSESMPVDAQPSPVGTIRLLEVATVLIPVARVCPDATRDLFDPSDDGLRFVAHFATCPNATDWRTS